MKTYPEMNDMIIGLLKVNGGPMCLYAAARIAELENQLAELKGKIEIAGKALEEAG